MSWVGLLHSPRMTREQPPETSPRHAVEARPLQRGCHLRAAGRVWLHGLSPSCAYSLAWPLFSCPTSHFRSWLSEPRPPHGWALPARAPERFADGASSATVFFRGRFPFVKTSGAGMLGTAQRLLLAHSEAQRLRRQGPRWASSATWLSGRVWRDPERGHRVTLCPVGEESRPHPMAPGLGGKGAEPQASDAAGPVPAGDAGDAAPRPQERGASPGCAVPLG